MTASAIFEYSKRTKLDPGATFYRLDALGDTLPSRPEHDTWEYATSLLLDVMERPDRSPLLVSLLERCAHMLFLFSQGETSGGRDNLRRGCHR